MLKKKIENFFSGYFWGILRRNSFLLILLLASYLRFTGLTNRDFWYDEAFTGVAIKESFANMIAMTINDVHPPLYYIILKGFASFFEYSVFGIRFFSAIIGVLCVAVAYLLAKELTNRKIALYSALITAVSPFAVQYSQEARMYTLLSFFVLLATYFFVRALKEDKTSYFIGWGIFMGLAALTHYMGIIYSAVFIPLFFFWKIKNKKINISLIKDFLKVKQYAKFLLGYFMAIVVFLPWMNNFIRHLQLKEAGGNLGWVKQASLGDIIYNFQMFLFGTPVGEFSSGMPNPNQILFVNGMYFSHSSIGIVLTIFLTVAALYLMRKGFSKEIKILSILSVGFLFIIYILSIISKDQQYFVARYLFPATYGLFIFIGMFLASIRFRYALIILLVYAFLILRIVPLQNSQSYNQMFANIGKYKNNNFYVLNSFDYVIAKYYFGKERVLLFNYDWPQYNPAACWPNCWAAIGPELKRTESYEDLKNDPRALIVTSRIPSKDTQYFNPQGLEVVDQYDNLVIFKFAKTQK